jgi:hypothetical protein
VFNEAGAGLRSDSKIGLDSEHFSEPFPEYSTGFMEPTLYSSVATMGSNNLDGNSRLETLMTEALYTNNLTQKETDALSAAGMMSSQVLCYFVPLIACCLVRCLFLCGNHATFLCLLFSVLSVSPSDHLQRCRKVLALHFHRTMECNSFYLNAHCSFYNVDGTYA